MWFYLSLTWSLLRTNLYYRVDITSVTFHDFTIKSFSESPGVTFWQQVITLTLCHPINTEDLIYQTCGNLGVLGGRFADLELEWTAVTMLVLALAVQLAKFGTKDCQICVISPSLCLRVSVIWDVSTPVSTISWTVIKSIKFSPDLGRAGGFTDQANISLLFHHLRERERYRRRTTGFYHWHYGTPSLLVYCIWISPWGVSSCLAHLHFHWADWALLYKHNNILSHLQLSLSLSRHW